MRLWCLSSLCLLLKFALQFCFVRASFIPIRCVIWFFAIWFCIVLSYDIFIDRFSNVTDSQNDSQSFSYKSREWKTDVVLPLTDQPESSRIQVSTAAAAAAEEEQEEEEEEEEPSDYEVWMAIKNSIEDWQRKQSLSTNNNDSRIRNKRQDLESVCYDNVGCFRHKGPFDYLNTLPASPELISTTFTLYTRRNPLEGQPLNYGGNNSIRLDNNSSFFNSSNHIKIIIHGFGSSSKRPWVMKMTEVLLELDDFNVISVDWQNGSKLPNYVQAAANTQLIGKQIARLIRMVEQVHHVPASHYHLIGFSLGAHVAGFTGQEIANISRITGLDPAAPLFEGYPPNVRLDSTDAQFVDVIHSNGDSFIRGGLGSYEPMGSVDFYPNGGRVQVGCSSALGVLTNILYHGQWNLLCNHRRAFRFFIDSLHPDCTFRAFSCSSYEEYVRGKCFDCGSDGTKCSNMGYYSRQSLGRGAMYLVTRDKEPFCVNQFRVQIQFGIRQGITWGNIELRLINVDGLNETFALTQDIGQLKEGQRIQALIVAHPKLTNITEVILTYTKYKGWLYNGQNEWNVDRIELLDSNFVIKTYCRPRTPLPNTIPISLKLISTNCTIDYDYYDHNEEDYDHNSIISNSVLPTELVTPSIDLPATMLTSEATMPSTALQYYHANNYYNGPPIYAYIVPDHHNSYMHQNHFMRKSHLPGDLYHESNSGSTTTQPQKSEPRPPSFELMDRKQNSMQSVSSNNLNNINNKMDRALRATSLPDKPLIPLAQDAQTNLVQTKHGLTGAKDRERSMLMESRMHPVMQRTAKAIGSDDDQNNNDAVSMATDSNEMKLKMTKVAVDNPVVSNPSLTSQYSISQRNFISPIINGASRIFWKFLNTFSTDFAASNQFYNHDLRNFNGSNSHPTLSANMGGEHGSQITSDEPLANQKLSSATFYPIRVDRIFVLSDGETDYRGSLAQDTKNKQGDGTSNDRNGQNLNDHHPRLNGRNDLQQKDCTGNHPYVLYSVAQINREQSSLIPVQPKYYNQNRNPSLFNMVALDRKIDCG